MAVNKIMLSIRFRDMEIMHQSDFMKIYLFIYFVNHEKRADSSTKKITVPIAVTPTVRSIFCHLGRPQAKSIYLPWN